MILCVISYVVTEFAIAKFPYDKAWTDAKGQHHKMHIEEVEVNSYYKISDSKYSMTYPVTCTVTNPK